MTTIGNTHGHLDNLDDASECSDLDLRVTVPPQSVKHNTT